MDPIVPCGPFKMESKNEEPRGVYIKHTASMDSSSFLLSFSSIISTLVYMMREPNFSWLRALPYIMPLCLPLLSYFPGVDILWEQWASLWNGCRRKNILEFTARLKLRSWTDEPDSVVRNFSVVLWEWNRTNMTVNCKSLMEEAVSSRFHDDQDEPQRRNCPLFVNDTVNPFWHAKTPHIQYLMWMERNTDREGFAHPEIILRMSFHNSVNTPNTIVEHIEYIKKEADRIHSERSRKQRVLVSTDTITQRNGDELTGGPEFMSYEFATTSSFANFFSEESATVDADLTYFLTNRDAYARTGRPWTYTVLNEGPPGVGKTKLVKAIAAKTGHTLIIINLAHIVSIQTLYEAFHSPILAGEYVPHEKRLYYIPEVDTQMLDMFKSRQAGPVAMPAESLDRRREKSERIKVSSIEPPVAKKPTLGEILNILDGVPERYGHILVLDTNHVSKLDPALIRPGRVDRIVSWQKMSSESMRGFIENYYMRPLPKSVVFPERTFTAAELQGIVSQYKDWETLLPVLMRPQHVPQKLKIGMTTRSSVKHNY